MSSESFVFLKEYRHVKVLTTYGYPTDPRDIRGYMRERLCFEKPRKCFSHVQGAGLGI